MSYHFVVVKTESERLMTKSLLETSHLSTDDHVTETYNLYDDKEMIGTISTHENVIKMIAVKEDRQGEQVTGHLLHHVMRIFEQKEINKYFLFTKPQNKSFFSNYNLSLIAETSDIALFENKLYPISDHLLFMKISMKPRHGVKACIVMNCNPITNGHLYLIETCSKEVDDVIIFLVEENKSVFPFHVRYNLVKQATKHIKNVHVLPSTPYIISLATFPTYFLKESKELSQKYMELDITIFKKYFFSVFELDYRYVGTEPKDEFTALYNDVMKDMLGDKLKVIERKSYHDDVISASTVRKLMLDHHYDQIKHIVPKATYKYLMSKEGKALFHA